MASLRDGSTVEIEPWSQQDAASLAAFLRAMPERDLLFFRENAGDEEVVAEWTRDERTIGTIARRNGEIAGFAFLRRRKPPWMRHVADVVAVVAPGARGLGLGTQLLRLAILDAGNLNAEKISAQIVVEDRDSVRVFEKLGFRHEGLLIDHAKASDGTAYDIASMGLSVARSRAALAAGDDVDLTRQK